MTDSPASSGPGTELKRLLSWIGIKPSRECSCTRRALLMDHQGCEWCRQNLKQIVGWLREEAENRKLPFSETAARLLIRLAIRRAERESMATQNRSSLQ